MDKAAQDARDTPSGGYRVLARKYRPKDFSDLIGQEPMVRTLTNAFEAGRIAQAWMLTGVRGVGKTTTARILARALNYRTADTDEPSIALAGLGEHCQAIMEGRHVDVLEMDAASHTGIDDIREIIDQVRYAPVSARYKVYIIDEVHMLSNQAFNGLLKTLEEPPPHVKFIFATTEIRKVPITVLSRCQRFDLRRIEPGVMTAHLKSIARLENIEIDDEALAAVARAGEGSARDSLSILDQAVAHGGGKVTIGELRDMLGLADRARVIDLFEKLMSGDVGSALKEFRAQYDGGADPGVVLGDLAGFNHLVTRLKFVPEAADDPSLSSDERDRGLDLAQKLPVRVLSRCWQMLLKGVAEVQAAGRPVDAAEMVLIRIAHAADLPTLDEALKRLANDSPTAGAVAKPAGAKSPPSEGGSASGFAVPAGANATTMRLVEPDRESQPEPSAAPQPSELPPKVEVPAVATLADIAALAEKHRDMAFKVAIKQFVRPVRLEPGRLEVSLTDEAPKTLLGELSSKLANWTGMRWIVSLSREEGGTTLAEEENGRRQSAIVDARADPAVAAILDTFPGSRIIDVRIPGDDVPDAGAEPEDIGLSDD